MIMDINIIVSNYKIFYYDKFEYDQITVKDMKYYRFQVEIPSSRHSTGDIGKSGDYSSHSQTSEGLIIVPSSSSSQSDDFNHFSQGNPENKQNHRSGQVNVSL